MPPVARTGAGWIGVLDRRFTWRSRMKKKLKSVLQMKTETVFGTKPGKEASPILVSRQAAFPKIIGDVEQQFIANFHIDCPHCGAGIAIRYEQQLPSRIKAQASSVKPKN